MSAEESRLAEAREQKVPWRKWGPYLSERQWGTVREDYSDSGDAWNYFPHDQARSRLRLSDVAPAALAQTNGGAAEPFGDAFEATLQARRQEANAFYATVIPAGLTGDEATIMRQALAGMLWSKQFYYYDVDRWLEERGSDPFKPTRKAAPRNDHWHHMYNADVISMPDKWEYPWYAAWDLAFHILPLTLVDEEFGKQQLDLMLQSQYLHPNGQLPAYEWNFGDVNPPVHAWSTIFTYRLQQARHGQGDLDWLERAFQKLLLNFTWWVNRKDRAGNNVFEGGFLGLDNIGVFDRSAPLPTGGYLEQADGTAWMALFCQNMLEIAVELAQYRPAYEDLAIKFTEHFLWIASSMSHAGVDTGMWDEDDGFFYDVLRLPDGSAQRLKVRSMVGLLPLCAATVFEGTYLREHPEARELLRRFLDARPELRTFIHDPTRATSALLCAMAGHDDNVSDVATRCYMQVAGLTHDAWHSHSRVAFVQEEQWHKTCSRPR